MGMRTTLRRITLAGALLLQLTAVPNCLAHDTLKVCGAPLPPYTYLKDGAATGIEVEIAQSVFSAMDVRFKVDIAPFARCQLLLATGQADMVFAVSPTPTREAFALFPKNAVWHISYVFFTNADTKKRLDIRGLEDAKRNHLQIGIVRGAAYYESFWKIFPNQEGAENEGNNPALIAAASSQENFHQLALNHVQLFPQDLLAGIWTAKQMGQTALYYDTVLFGKDYPSAFSRASTFSNARYRNIETLAADYDVHLEAFKKTPRYRKLFQLP